MAASVVALVKGAGAPPLGRGSMCGGAHGGVSTPGAWQELGQGRDKWGRMGCASVSVVCTSKKRRKRAGREALMSSTLAQGSSPRWALAYCQEVLGEELACPGQRSPSVPSQSKLDLAQGT